MIFFYIPYVSFVYIKMTDVTVIINSFIVSYWKLNNAQGKEDINYVSMYRIIIRFPIITDIYVKERQIRKGEEPINILLQPKYRENPPHGFCHITYINSPALYNFSARWGLSAGSKASSSLTHASNDIRKSSKSPETSLLTTSSSFLL